MFDHPSVNAIADYLFRTIDGHESSDDDPKSPETESPRSSSPGSSANTLDESEDVGNMTEQQALEALLREVND